MQHEGPQPGDEVWVPCLLGKRLGKYVLVKIDFLNIVLFGLALRSDIKRLFGVTSIRCILEDPDKPIMRPIGHFMDLNQLLKEEAGQ